MRALRIVIGTALLLLPLAAWAQNCPDTPPEPSAVPAGAVIIGQNQADIAPPKQVWVQRRDTAGGGPETFGAVVNAEPGMGLGAWWKNSEIVRKLNLSDEQVKNISRTYLEHKLKLIDLQADVEKQELLLQPLMDIDQPDQNKVGAQIDLITEARGKLEKENAMMMLAIRRWLSVEQWKTLKSLEATEERHNVFFMRTGPGMMEGPPPPLPGDMPAEK